MSNNWLFSRSLANSDPPALKLRSFPPNTHKRESCQLERRQARLTNTATSFQLDRDSRTNQVIKLDEITIDCENPVAAAAAAVAAVFWTEWRKSDLAGPVLRAEALYEDS
jgi:hypothetical protein